MLHAGLVALSAQDKEEKDMEFLEILSGHAEGLSKNVPGKYVRMGGKK